MSRSRGHRPADGCGRVLASAWPLAALVPGPRAGSGVLELVSIVGLESAPADQAAGQADQPVVEVAAAFVADGQALEGVQPGKGALDDPTPAAEARAVLDAAPGDAVGDAAAAQLAAVLVVVVAAIGDD